MNYDDALVGSIAIVLAIISFAFAIGPWQRPYELRSISAVRERFGKPIARGVWVAIALATFSAGLAIINGIRPSYATPHVTANP
ncbi:hypothetical protein N9N28_18170 [Rubripirellula amarantea]|uniref:Uncharacterized protein n=1 Tax=Rubripirellula amarantea TaxID=2527999 RepID=A0A5C5WK26_9BACT|nr:hypothetical protein [Rubripirellula amarantea]MDA8746550.1 hypothetical protein [Rubripirellula amarantea]TWT50489.1 hypothetical protein Pla22_32320 [Rubripirellula amarantea]